MRKKEFPIGHWFTHRQCFCRWGVVVCILIGLFSFLPAIFADGESVNRYRQWFIPEEKIPAFSLEPSLPINRQRFENWVEQIERKTEQQSIEPLYLSKIVLKAQLTGRQLTSGQGFLTLHPRFEESSSIPLDPLALAVHSLRWSDDSEAILFCGSDGGSRLLVPSATDSNSYDHLQFRWSLQSRKDYRSGIVFDIALPPCLSIELQIDLPSPLALTASTGLVFLDENESKPDSEFRTWKILLGHHSNTTLTITADKTSPPLKQKPAIHQIVSYTVTPQGLEALTRISFDGIDSRTDELLLELEQPLRPVEVKYGEQTAQWTRSPVSSGMTEVRIDLSPFAREEPQEISVLSLGPLLENQRWTLPRVRVTSPDILWMSTRCGVSVESPLRARNLLCDQAVQVPFRPTTNVDWTKRELYVFQFFQDDAQIELEVMYSIPQIKINSAAQIHWNNNEIRSTVYLDCSITEGERFTLNVPLAEHWIIDSVTSYSPPTRTPSAEGEPVFSWDVLESAQFSAPPTLSVQLNRPLRPRIPLTLQLSCRFINNSAQNQFRLAELSPLVLPHRYGESHYIAMQVDLTDYSLQTSADAAEFSIPGTLTWGGHSWAPAGNVYPLNSQTKDIRFDLERTRANYTADISGNVYIDNGEMIQTYRIRCTLIDSSIERVFVHFTPTGKETPQWDWSLTGIPDSSRSLRPRKLSSKELQELMPVFEPQNRSEDLERGEVWEIRLGGLQSAPFELSAVSSIPLADSMPISFASLPRASSQRGELTIESPQYLGYRITGAPLPSIPVALPAWNRYQNVRAAFRYDPQEELRRSQYAPLLLQKRAPEDQGNTAWVWSLRLDSQYEPEGFVRNKALFLVENQGKPALQIALPQGISAADVSAVWRDSQQIPWQYDADQRTIAVVLPAGQRFVSIYVEYTYQDMPLGQRRKLRPRSPSADVPILSGSWIAWFPPEFEVSGLHDSSDVTKKVSISKTLDYLLTGTYRSYLGAKWEDIFYGQQRQREIEAAAQCFFDAVADALHDTAAPPAAWGDLLGNEKTLSAVRTLLVKDTKRFVETKFLLDKQALAFLGITPATPIEEIGTVTHENIREKLFERAGLMLLAAAHTRSDGIKEYIFALTTPTTLSLNQQIRPIPLGYCVRMVPAEIFDSPSNSMPDWVTSSRWLSETTLSSIPWSVSAQVMPWSALTLDWNAYELPLHTEQPLYIVHRQKFLAVQWIAFLSLVLLTCRKPFSSPIVLFALLIVFELIARSVSPCYVGIPSGAFLGVLVSFGFALIRSQISPVKPSPDRPARDDSTECSVSFVKTALLHRCFLLGALGAVFAGTFAPAAAQTLSDRVQPPRKEPYRVFYPTNAEGQVVGNNVWVPVELIDLLNQHINVEHSVVSQPWSIVKAVYQGSLIRGTSGKIECSDDFKAVYDIYLDSPHATVTLPPLPAVQGKLYWDSEPIWKDDTKEGALSFVIENERPGRHTLEIALSPSILSQNSGAQNGEGAGQIAFAIPKVPDSTLSLNVPPDMQPVNVPDALGAVTDNSMLSPVLTAELGAVSQLSLSWVDDPSRSGTLVNDVEQFFWIRVRPSHIELNTLFRYRIEGGQIRQLNIQTDPRWSRSGQFSCVEQHPFTLRSETSAEGYSLDSPYNTAQIDFQSPVSGTLTLRATFVLRDFNGIRTGIGNLRLPEFKALQARITKSMLAVSAEPTLELDFPAEGRSSGFESGWQETFVVTPQLFGGGGTIWDIADTLFQRRNELSPDVAYDLTQTEPDWMVNIRSKKIVPRAAVSQSIQLDAGESKVHAVGEFSADSNVFRQSFSADRPIQIETIEIRNSRGEWVESHWQQTGTETMPEQYIVFFRQPVTGKYTVTIRGFFETDAREELSQQPVPVLTFGEAQTTDHSLHLFRTPKVLAEIPPEQSGWSRLSALPSVPESFTQSLPLGTWQKAASTEQTLPVKDEPSGLLCVALSANRPKVQFKTNLSLQTDSEGYWTMLLDFTGSVISGELKSLSFRWDERCGIIQSIEPAAAYTLEQSGGQQTLTLYPDEPMRGEQNFKMTVLLNTSGTVSLPNVFPLAGDIDSFESEIGVDLPYKQGNDIISWELNMLEAIEEHAADAPRLFYRAVDTRFSAAVSQGEARLTALFYDIGFLVQRDGTVIGTATIDLRNRGQNSFVLQMPPEYELLQISSGGLMLEHTQLAENNRRRIHIGTSDYPQRLNVLFRTSLRRPVKQWNRAQIVSELQFPFLEGVAVQDTIWTAAFEGNLPTLNVAYILNQQTDLGNYVPVSGEAAALSLVGINLIREHNLLRVLNSLSVLSRQEEEMRRWYSHWLEEWNTVADKVDFQVSHLPLMLQNVTPKFIVRTVDSTEVREESWGIVRPFLRTMSAKSREALRSNKEQSVREKFGTAADTIFQQPVPILNSQVYWQGRISDEMQYLFGTEEGVLRSVRLTSVLDAGGWTMSSLDYIWIWISLALLLPVMVLLSVRLVYVSELWLQFPHFWGMSAGVLLWTFLPESFIGLVVIILTVLSLFRPSWPRRRFVRSRFDIS